jgi:CDP-diacylglycerol--glycerol-3-phosphate 3-phosphatidyltransferase
MNFPNFLTLLRVFFAIEVFVFCAYRNWELCLLFFIAASVTDFLDGWWARKYNQITVFGRIMDPFADKFLICGTFICLLGIISLTRRPPAELSALLPTLALFQPWMVVVLVARELLITSLRAFVEKSGGDFSAKWIGKWKMGLQCAALVVCFLYLSFSDHVKFWENFNIQVTGLPLAGLYLLWILLLWATVVITLYSGVSYSIRAARVIQSQSE